MTHAIGLVTYDGAVHAWVLDLPGAIAGARDLDALGDVLPLTIAEHVTWLHSHGEDDPHEDEWQIVETIDGESLAAMGGEFCFAHDQTPLGRDEMERLIARLQWSRADVLDAVANLPAAILDWAPPLDAMASIDAWAPEVRTIREITSHVLQLEAYYRGGLHDGPATGIFEPVADPAAERARTLDMLRDLPEQDRSRVFMPVRPGRTTPEPWTVRKLIARTIAHERTHAAEVQQRRTWLLLGVPRLRDHS